MENDELPHNNTGEEQQKPVADESVTTETSTKQAESSADSQPAAEPTTEQVSAPKLQPSRRRLFLTIGLAILLVVIAAVAGWYLLHKKSDKQQASITATPTAPSSTKPADTTAPAPESNLDKLINPQTDERWLATPKKVADLHLVKGSSTISPQQTIDDYTYYEVGSRNGNTIYIAEGQTLDTISTVMFEKGSDGVFRYIVHPNPIANYDKAYVLDQNYLVSQVITDQDTHYDSLALPAAFTLDNGDTLSEVDQLYFGSLYGLFGTDDSTKRTVVKTIGQTKIVKTEKLYTDTKLTAIGYAVVTPMNTQSYLTYKPLETELKDYQWQRGVTKVDDSINSISQGCGGASASVTRADNISDADLQLAGTSPSGSKVYEADANNALVKKAYSEFQDFFKGDATVKPETVSMDEFIKQHAVLFFKDKDGEWLVYARSQYRPVGGCAKPVVYLYPTKAEQVHVTVGADVKVSVPTYDPKRGWTVWAQPNGQLSLNGTTYDSLFWEGPGKGEYPGITSGTIVPRSQAVATIRSQLAQLGLNQKESTDFLAYWQNKLPNKPYVRLTWLTTEQMNRLAPLQITPVPDTLIRVFLDFSGLDTPINLPQQQLSSIPRRGFTVVEWGGLSPYKLY